MPLMRAQWIILTTKAVDDGSIVEVASLGRHMTLSSSGHDIRTKRPGVMAGGPGWGRVGWKQRRRTLTYSQDLQVEPR